jgi:hypothetical protein
MRTNRDRANAGSREENEQNCKKLRAVVGESSRKRFSEIGYRHQCSCQSSGNTLKLFRSAFPLGESCTVDDAYSNGEMEKMI